jgi:hypothetical protein
LIAESVGEVTVRGRARPLRVYKVLGVDDVLLPEAAAAVGHTTGQKAVL